MRREVFLEGFLMALLLLVCLVGWAAAQESAGGESSGGNGGGNGGSSNGVGSNGNGEHHPACPDDAPYPITFRGRTLCLAEPGSVTILYGHGQEPIISGPGFSYVGEVKEPVR
jgi:hypothetical protein